MLGKKPKQFQPFTLAQFIQQFYNPSHNILRLFYIVPNFSFTVNVTEHGY